MNITGHDTIGSYRILMLPLVEILHPLHVLFLHVQLKYKPNDFVQWLQCNTLHMKQIDRLVKTMRLVENVVFFARLYRRVSEPCESQC